MMIRSYDFKVGGQSFTARIVEYTESRVVVELNGNVYEVELSSDRPVLAGAPIPARPAATSPVPIHERKQPAPAPASQSAAASAAAIAPASAAPGSGTVVAPIPGVVKKIPVAVGDEVTESTVVLILEAMKMENEISARVAGKVSEIKVALGDSVQEGQALLQIEVS